VTDWMNRNPPELPPSPAQTESTQIPLDQLQLALIQLARAQYTQSQFTPGQLAQLRHTLIQTAQPQPEQHVATTSNNR